MSNIIKIDNQNFKAVQEFTKVPLPQFEEKENKQRGWISCGVDNKFPYYLTSLLAKSPIHAAIVKKKSMLIGGRGFITTNIGTDTIFFLKNSRNSMDLDEILHKVAYDFEVFGAFALNIVWSKDRESISEINYIDVSKLRIAIPEEGENDEIESYWISDGWENIKKYPPIKYDGFSTVDRSSASQICYVRDHRAGTEWYGQPEYLSGIFWMEMQIQVSQFHLANVNNGFFPSFHINWPIPQNFSEEELETLQNRLRQQFQGSINAGESFITIQDNDSAPTITAIEANTSDDRFVNIQDMTERNILQSHRVNNAELFGLSQEGKLGTTKGERLESMQEFEIDYVIPKQQILEKVFNKLARINGITDKLYINKYSDQYKKVGSDSATEILAIISNKDITPKQKYYLLTSLNYTHDLASNLSGYYDGNNLKTVKKDDKQPNTKSVKNNKFDDSDFEEIHLNCRCRIEDGVFITEDDCCDDCQEAADDYNSNKNNN